MKELAIVIAVAFGIVYVYMQSTFHTLRPCDALQQVTVREAPAVLRAMADRNGSAALVALGSLLMDPDGAAVREFAKGFAQRWADELTAGQCALLVAYAEVDGKGFRGDLADAILDGMSS